MDPKPSEVVAPPNEKPPSMLTADQLEQLQQQAYQEGYELGKQEGFDYGHKEALAEGRQRVQAQIDAFEALLSTLEHPLQQLDEQV